MSDCFWACGCICGCVAEASAGEDVINVDLDVVEKAGSGEGRGKNLETLFSSRGGTDMGPRSFVSLDSTGVASEDIIAGVDAGDGQGETNFDNVEGDTF